MPSFHKPVLCVDIGGTSTKAAILNAKGLNEREELGPISSIPSSPDVGSYFDALIALIHQTRASVTYDFSQSPSELGVSVAGFLDADRSHLVYNPNLAWLEKFPLRERLVTAFPGLRIELEVDSNAATMAEYHLGTGSGYKRFLCLTSGTGLGVGMTVEGKPLRFAYGCMGDIGHVVVQPNGPLCTCGGRGCAEIMVSAPVLAERYRHAAGVDRPLTLRDVIEAADAGDGAAIQVLAEAGEWLGLAIASIANTVFPDHIAIAGGLSAAGDHVLKPAERMFRETACILARSGTGFTKAKLGPLAPLIGAAWPFWSEESL